MIPIFIVFRIQIAPYLLLLPLALLLHLAFTMGVALLLSCINVYFRDVTHLLGVGLMFWFWLTPIFYSLDMVPIRFRWICIINPMTSYVTIYRNILFEAKVPNLYIISIALGAAVGVLLVGYIIFAKLERSFAKGI